MNQCEEAANTLKRSLELLTASFDECIEFIREQFKMNECLSTIFDNLVKEVRLYNIEQPMVLLSADYGVPQNRERVLFIGCRNDQELITEIPSTVTEEQKVKVYEALWDLDMIGNGEIVTDYKEPKIIERFEPLKRKRTEQGEPTKDGLLFSEWSRKGRLSHRFTFDEEPFYVKNNDELSHCGMHQRMSLFNHQTSQQNEAVRERLQIIAKYNDYHEAKAELKTKGLDSHKRNYTVLNPAGQSPTVCTMPDDFIHYSGFRPMTVREMARLQSFDDSFVFQGKRQTGGNNRQKEIPQYTLVGNAVPPLMARAIANTLLKHIK
jgi:DNA (cytosine-5)-methyltransferase 1